MDCPPQVQLAEGELEAALEVVERGEVVLSPVYRHCDDDEPEVIAEGYERPVEMAVEVQVRARVGRSGA